MMTPEVFHRLFLKATKSKSSWIWAHGLCFEYAYCFLKVVGGEGTSYLTHRKQYQAYGHCFVKYQDKYFDSESSEGQTSWKKLQSYMNRASDKKIIKHRSVSSLTFRWGLSQERIKECDRTVERINLLFKQQS